MKLVPKYTVWYKGEARKQGIAFEIDDSDEQAMEQHGKIVKKTVRAKKGEAV